MRVGSPAQAITRTRLGCLHAGHCSDTKAVLYVACAAADSMIGQSVA